MTQTKSIPSVSVTYAANGRSKKSNEFGMRPMQERAYRKPRLDVHCLCLLKGSLLRPGLG